MIASYTTHDGYTLRVFSSAYLDWGLEITGPRGEEVYYSPTALCREAYGLHWESEDGEELDEGVEWTIEEWILCLRAEADDLIETYLDKERE